MTDETKEPDDNIVQFKKPTTKNQIISVEDLLKHAISLNLDEVVLYGVKDGEGLVAYSKLKDVRTITHGLELSKLVLIGML